MMTPVQNDVDCGSVTPLFFGAAQRDALRPVPPSPRPWRASKPGSSPRTPKLLHALLLALLVGFGPGGVWACPIPVFRYALEKGSVDLYSLSIIHSGELSVEQGKLLARLKQPGVAGVELKDIAAPPPESAPPAMPPAPPILPWLVLRHQNPVKGESQVAWEAPLTRETVEHLLNAPDRVEIARRLLAGDSAVWLFFPGTNATENAAVMKRVTGVLEDAEEDLELPSEESSSLSSIPLKLRFSILTIEPGTPGGDLLKKMLRPLAPDIESMRSPAVVPVYGRGHALAVIAGKDLSESNLRLTCEFLTGSCSCIYKARTPGLDLFFALDWQSKVVDRPEAAERPRRPGFPAPPLPKPVGPVKKQTT